MIRRRRVVEVVGDVMGVRVSEVTSLTGSDQVRVETSPKRVRAYLGGHVVLDTTEARLVWESSHHDLPHYYAPLRDVRAELIPTGRTKTSRSRGVGQLHTVRIGAGEAFEAALTYPDSPVTALRDLVRIKFDAMDAWFEEDEEIYTHPRSPYTRIDILPTSRAVVVEADGHRIAETSQAHMLFETGLPARFYLPKVDVRLDLLVPSALVTHCPYKGRAEYWSVRVGGKLHEDAVWSYRHPLPESARLAGLLSFYPSRLDVMVDGVPLPSR
jgi:uncharacterized protein (DUF427 family)